MRKSLVGATCILAAVALGAPTPGLAKPAPKKGHKVVPAVHLCAWISASGAGGTLELEGSCKEGHGHPKTVHTPLGSYTSTLYTAKWGVANLSLLPQHVVSALLAHVTGSSAVVAYVKKKERAKVLSNGAPVVASKTVLATWAGETASCKNPPTGDCTTNEFEAVKGNWEMIVVADGAPPGSPGAEEESSGEDDAQDLAQEELLKGPTVGIGTAIVGKV